MNEDTTRELPNDDVKRILSRFDAVDARFDSVDGRFDSVDARLNSVETRLDSVDGRLDSVDRRLDSVDSRLTTLEVKVDERLKETRPIWERALAEIATVRAETQQGFAKVHTELDHGLRRMAHQVDALNQTFLEMRGEMRYMDSRITKLESEPAQ